MPIYDVLPEFYSCECNICHRNVLMSAILNVMTMLLLMIFIGFIQDQIKNVCVTFGKICKFSPVLKRLTIFPCLLRLAVYLWMLTTIVRQLKRTGNSILNLVLSNRLMIVRPSINNLRFRVHMIPQVDKNRKI